VRRPRTAPGRATRSAPVSEPSTIDQVTLNAGDRAVTLPVARGTLGAPCIEIAKLPKETGCFTYDPGFTATASCRSAITYIDGDAGVLLYRGYPIEQLAKDSSFLEVAYLLMHGELPDKAAFSSFEHDVTHHTMLHEAFKGFLGGFRHDAHPMSMLVGMLGSMASFYHNDLDYDDPEQRHLAAVRLIAKLPTIAAACHRHSVGWPLRYPRNHLDYVDRFLHMMFEVPSGPREMTPVAATALGLLLIVHTDGAPGRLHRCEPLRVHRRRRGGAVGPGARRRQRGSAEDARRDRRREARAVGRRQGQGQGVGFPPDGLRPPRVQELRPARQDHPRDVPPGARGTRRRRPAAGSGDEARGSRAEGRLLRAAQAVPERRLLLRHHLQGAGHPDRDVHGDVRHRPHRRLGRALAGAADRPGVQDRPPAPDLHRPR